MRFKVILGVALAAIGLGAYALLASAQTHRHDMAAPAAVQADARQLVKFPEPMRLHTITSMRDHLLSLQEIDVALSKNDFDKASRIAEQRLPRREVARCDQEVDDRRDLPVDLGGEVGVEVHVLPLLLLGLQLSDGEVDDLPDLGVGARPHKNRRAHGPRSDSWCRA